MKKEVSLRLSWIERVKLSLVGWADAYASLLSFCLEEEISAGHALRITHAMLAFTFLVFSCGNALLSVLFLVWFVLTLRDCKRAGIR